MRALKICLVASTVVISAGLSAANAGQLGQDKNIASAPLAPLPKPNLLQGLDPKLVAWVNGCFDQANKRRKLGIDVRPQFTDSAGQQVDLPTKNAFYTCHVDGSGN